MNLKFNCSIHKFNSLLPAKKGPRRRAGYGMEPNPRGPFLTQNRQVQILPARSFESFHRQRTLTSQIKFDRYWTDARDPSTSSIYHKFMFLSNFYVFILPKID